MNKIQFLISPDACFVYHMLSVAGCGYDNDHGRTYRCIYPAEDLAILKAYESLLTVEGGAHCGALYWYLVAQPACGKVPAIEYYRDFPKSCYMEDLAGFSQPIRQICAVMIRCYPIYLEHVWPQSSDVIRHYIEPLASRFEDGNFTELAEAHMGCVMEQPVFYAVMTDSMENGAEAIDIAPDMDVFSITRPHRQAYQFIAHEYIIYLLKVALRDTTAFQSFETWTITEALAEYYLQQIMGQTGMFLPQSNWIRFYEECRRQNPALSPVSLYLAAEKELTGK